MNLILNQYEVNCSIKSISQQMEELGIENSCFISILKGGIYTTYTLLPYFSEQIKKDILIGNLGLASYAGELVTQEKISITYPLDLTPEQLEGKDIWIIDDIFDSGLTMTNAKSIIKREMIKNNRKYNSIQTVVLVRKMNPKIKLHKNTKDLPDIVGFEYENSGFLVGMGMGLGEKYRCLDQLYELEPGEILT